MSKKYIIFSALLLLCSVGTLQLAAQDAPVPDDLAPITVDNAAQVRQLAQFGQGVGNQMTFSPDGNTLLVGSHAGLFAYDLQQPDARPRRLDTETGIIGGTAFSPDGNLLAIGGMGVVYLWDAHTMTPLGSFGGYDDVVTRLVFTSDSQRLFVAGSGHFAQMVNIAAVTAPDVQPCMATAKQSVRVRNGVLGLQIDTLKKGASLTALAFAHGDDGARWLELEKGEQAIEWGVASAFDLGGSCDGLPLTFFVKEAEVSRNYSSYNRQVEFSETKNVVYMDNVEGDNDSIHVWDATTGARAGTVQPNSARDGRNFAQQIRVSPDGTVLAAAGFEIVRLFDTASGKETDPYEAGQGTSISRLEFSPNGQILAMVMTQYPSTHYFVRLLDMQSQEAGSDLNAPYGADALAFSPDSSRLAIHAPSADSIDIWDVRSRQKVMQLSWEVTPHTLDRQFPDKPYGVEVGSNPDSVAVWDYTSGQQSSLPSIEGRVLAYSWSQDYSLIAVVTESGVSWYERATAKQLGKADFPSGDPYQYLVSSAPRLVTFSPDNRSIAFTLTNEKRDNFIEVYSVQDNSEVGSLRMQGQIPQILRFTPDSSLLDSGDDDGKIRVWDLQRGSAAREYTVGKNGIYDLDYSPDGTKLAVISAGVNVLDVNTGAKIYQVQPETAYFPIRVQFSPNGRLLAIGAAAPFPGYAALFLLDVRTGDTLNALPGYPFWTVSVDFSSDGTRLLTTDQDGVIRLWGVAS